MFRVQTAARVNEWVERVGVFVAVEATSPVFSEGSGAGGGREKAVPEERVVGLKRGTNGENICIMLFLKGPAVGRLIKPIVSGIINGHNNRIMARSRLP